MLSHRGEPPRIELLNQSGGLNLVDPPWALNANELQRAEGATYYDGIMSKRAGFVTKNTGGPIVDYSTGTVNVSEGSDVITGTGTAWSANAEATDGFYGPDSATYGILSVDGDTQITLRSNYAGVSAAGAAYAITSPIRGLYRCAFNQTSPADCYVGFAGKKIFALSDDGTVTVINSDRTKGCWMTAAVYGGLAYIYTSRDSPLKWTGNVGSAASAAVGPANSCLWVTFWRHRAYATGDFTQPRRIYASALGLPENWTSTYDAFYGDLPADELSPITGLWVTTYGLLVFTRRGVYITYGGGPDDFGPKCITTSVGCVAPYSICEYGGVVYFFGGDGWYRIAGTDIRRISDKIEPLVRDIEETELAATLPYMQQGAACAWRDRLFCSYHHSATPWPAGPNESVECDLRHATWFGPHSAYQFSCFATKDPGSNWSEVVAGDAAAGFVYALEQHETTDYPRGIATAIPFDVIFPGVVAPAIEREKWWRNVNVVAPVDPTGPNLTVEVYEDLEDDSTVVAQATVNLSAGGATFETGGPASMVRSLVAHPVPLRTGETGAQHARMTSVRIRNNEDRKTFALAGIVYHD